MELIIFDNDSKHYLKPLGVFYYNYNTTLCKDITDNIYVTVPTKELLEALFTESIPAYKNLTNNYLTKTEKGYYNEKS